MTERGDITDLSMITLAEADAEEIAGLYARCDDYFLLQNGSSPTPDDARELFTDVPSQKKPGDQAVLGWRGGEGLDALAAILSDYPHDAVWYLGFLIVSPNRRGRGLGAALYRQVEAFAEDRGAREIRLAVLEANPAADRFWRSLGFTEHRRVAAETFGSKIHRRIELRKPLVPGFAADRDR